MRPRLQTDRFLPRPLEEGDESALGELYSDAEVMNFLHGGTRSKATTRDLLQFFLDHWEKNGFGMWIISPLEAFEFLGCIGFRKNADRAGIELGYILHRKAWGMGVATEVGRKCLEHGFRTLGFDLIYSVVHPDNVASMRVLEKIGMSHIPAKDGTFRSGEFRRYYCINRERYLN